MPYRFDSHDDDDNNVCLGRVEVRAHPKGSRAILCIPIKSEWTLLEKETWIPFSQIGSESEIDSDSERGDKGTLYVTSWLAKQEGWETD
jgi:hypothetical protein